MLGGGCAGRTAGLTGGRKSCTGAAAGDVPPAGETLLPAEMPLSAGGGL